MPEGLDIGKLVGYVELDDSGVAEGAQSVKERLKELGASGKGLGALAGIGAGAAVAAGLAGAMELEPAKAKLTAQLGLTENESKRIGGVAGNLYSGAYGDSMEQVNEAIAAVVHNIDGMGKASSASLEDVSSKVLALTSTFDLDLGETTRAVGVMMRTGMAKDADQALDVITKGLQNGTDSAGDLLDTFDEYSTQFRKLGLDGPSALGLLSQGLKGGARDADTVADALKELSIRAVDGSETTAAGYQLLGLNASQMAQQFSAGGKTASGALDTVLERLKGIPDPVTRSSAAVDLFGTKAEDLGQALYSLDPTTAVASLGKIDGAAAQVAKTTGGTAVAQFQAFGRTLQTFATGTVGDVVLPLVTKLGGTLLTVVTPPLKALGDVVEGAAHLFGELPGPIQTTALVLAGLIVFSGPLSAMFTTVKASAVSALETIQLRALYAREAMAENGLAGGIAAAAGAGERAAAGGLSRVAGVLGGPLGLAIAGVTVAIPLLSALFGHNDDAAAKAARANSDLANALKESNGVINDNVRAAAAKEAQDKGLLDVAEKAGVPLHVITDALLGNKDAYKAATQALTLYQDQHKQYTSAGKGGAIEGLDDEGKAAKGAKDSLTDLAATLPETTTKQKQLADATDDTADAQDTAGAAIADTTVSAQQQTDALNALKSAFDRYTGNAISAAEAQITVSDGLEKLTAASTASARGFDLTTQSGRDAEKAVLGQITAITDLATATYQSTGSSDAAKASWDKEVGALRDRLYALGYNKGAVDDLVKTYATIPASVFTTVGTNAADVTGQIDALTKRLTTLSQGRYFVNVYETESGGKTLGKAYNARGGLYHFYADGGLEGAQPMAAGRAAVVPANTLRVIGDRAHGDEFYLPDDDAPATMGYGREWARRRGLALVPVDRYADGGTHTASAPTAAAVRAASSSSSTSSSPGVLFTGPVSLRDTRDAQALADEIDWRRRTKGRRR